ncbi:hypothetical protein SDC9_192679 [bioreactor metagenome]|uniref:Uncharacterized protein n=1 Tax=bioreactor metagenome TaxID=1076179 RepID=A0A645I2X3_9ZZZZ
MHELEQARRIRIALVPQRTLCHVATSNQILGFSLEPVVHDPLSLRPSIDTHQRCVQFADDFRGLPEIQRLTKCHCGIRPTPCLTKYIAFQDISLCKIGPLFLDRLDDSQGRIPIATT